MEDNPSITIKTAEAEAIRSDVERFLANGGKIEVSKPNKNLNDIAGRYTYHRGAFRSVNKEEGKKRQKEWNGSLV